MHTDWTATYFSLIFINRNQFRNRILWRKNSFEQQRQAIGDVFVQRISLIDKFYFAMIVLRAVKNVRGTYK